MEVLASGKGVYRTPDPDGHREWVRAHKSRVLESKLMTAKEAVEKFVSDGDYLGYDLNIHRRGPTALVHEAYIRLVGSEDPHWDSRGHFFAAAAEAMRRILVDNARHKGRIRLGGGRRKVLAEQADLASEVPSDDLLALDEALTKLAREDPAKSRLIELRFFAGLTIEQAAQVLGISLRTAYDDWAYAKCWLRVAMSDS